MMIKTFLIILSLCFCSIMLGQNKAVNTKKIDTLLMLKKQMINNHKLKSFYTIQLFSGEKENAEKTKIDYDQKAYDYKAIIVYETPNYKVWIGQFRTKLHADKAFSELKKDYPSALIFKPGR